MDRTNAPLDCFLRDINRHELTVIRDDGVYRHLSIGRPGSSIYRFDLVTWPGYLSVTGDMGTWTFSRTHDMFEFFPAGVADGINPYYWSKKFQAGPGCARREICYEFDNDAFGKALDEWHEEWLKDDNRSQDMDEEVAKTVSELIGAGFNHDGEAYRAVDDADLPGLYASDFFEGYAFQKYTAHYIWICYAIVWGIGRYKGKLLSERAAQTYLRSRVASQGAGFIIGHQLAKGIEEVAALFHPIFLNTGKGA